MKSWLIDPVGSKRYRYVSPAAGGGFTIPTGGTALLLGENDGFSTDFLYPTDTERVAVKANRKVTKYGVDSFYQNASTSPKMVYDVAGVLGWSPHNTILQSENLQASWTFIGATAPTATFMRTDTSSLSHRAMATSTTAVIGQTWTQSAIVSASGYSKVGFLEAGTNFVDVAFDLSNGTKIYQNSAGNGTITALGGGQYLITNTIVIAAASVRFYLYILPDSYTTGVFPNWTPDGVGGINIFRQQTNLGPVPTAYLKTTTAARYGLALDYDPVTHAAKGALVEPSATNTCTQSSAGRPGFLWSGNGSTRTTSAEITPAGGQDALQVVITPVTGPGSGLNASIQCTTVIGTVYTASMWCKGTAGQQIWFGTDSNSSQSQQTLVTFTGAWQRVSKTITATVTLSWLAWECYDRTGGAAHLPAITFHVWGGQYEVSTGVNNVTTSYIPTYGASATRVGDAYNITPASINYSSTAGSWWADVRLYSQSATSPRIVGYTTGSCGPIYYNATTISNYDGSVILAKSGLTNFNTNLHMVATAFQSGDRAVTADGLTVASDTTTGSALFNPGALIYIGGHGPGGNATHGHIARIRYVPRRKTNAELQAETVLDGGKGLIADEAAGFATDFTWATDAQRVTVKTAGIPTEYGLDAFYQNASTSPKMVYDATGKLGWSPHNACLQSQTFDNASWTKTACTIGANVIAAPDGTTTADAIIPNAGSFIPFVQSAGISVVATAPYTYSAYVKNGTLGNNWMSIEPVSSSTFRCYFNLATGAKGTSVGSPISYNATAIGNGWYRLDVAFPGGGSTSLQCGLYARFADGVQTAITGDGTSPAFYAWGAQVNRGSAPTAYLPTTTAARYGLAIDYDPTTRKSRGLLCEPAATNKIVRSDCTGGTWSSDSTIQFTPNAVLAPDGTLTATKAGAIWTQAYAYTNFSGQNTGTYSIFAKAGTLSEIVLTDDHNYVDQGTAMGFDLINGLTFQPIACPGGQSWNMPSSPGATMQKLPNGWWRLSIQVNNTDYASYWLSKNHMPQQVPESQGVVLDGAQALYIWGAQMEAFTSAAPASSPIPTLGATVTRVGDIYNIPAATSINHSGTAGSWWIDLISFVGANGIMLIKYTSTGTPIGMPSGVAVSIVDGTSLSKTWTAIGSHKVASAFQSGDRAITYDGLAVATDAGQTTNLLAPGASVFIGSNTYYGYIRKVRYVPRRKTNAELQTETL